MKRINLRIKAKGMKGVMFVFFLTSMMFFFLTPTTNYRAESVIAESSTTTSQPTIRITAISSNGSTTWIVDDDLQEYPDADFTKIHTREIIT